MELAAVDNDVIVAATDLQRVIGEQCALVRIVLYAAVLQAVDSSGHQFHIHPLGVDYVDGRAGGVFDGHAIQLQHHLFLRIDFNLSVGQTAADPVGAALGDTHLGATGGNALAFKAHTVSQQGDGLDI